MKRARKRALAAFRKVWWWLRQVSGDAAYENYLRSLARRAPRRSRAAARECAGGERPLSAEEFYLDALRRRYSGVSRCC
jgi:uncharacterized short protein YbdD (DUF466 family)